MDRIGGTARVRDTLTTALAEGRGVTAKVRWLANRNGDEEGRARWIHCTPLLGQNGAIGVWMVVLIEDENASPSRKFKQAPPVESHVSMKKSSAQLYESPIVEPSLRRQNNQDVTHRVRNASGRPGSGYSLGHSSLESFTIDPA